MENKQSKQQQSSELSYSMLARSSRRKIAQSAIWNSLLALIKHRPWLVWSGVWVFLIAIAAISVLSLTNTGRVEQEKPAQTPVAAENPAKTSSHPGSPMALWLLGAVAFTCAAGSLAIYKRLNHSSGLRQRQRAQRSSVPVLTRSRERFRRRPVPAETEPVVTVLPPEESHPLDSGEESLAEMMDIRKHRSLSSILRNL